MEDSPVSVSENEQLIDSDDEKMDLLEFIRSIDRENRANREANGSSSPESQISTAPPGVTSGYRKFSDFKSASVERKLSADSTTSNPGGNGIIPRKLKPSLRMKAYKGRRQETFHSLEAYVAKNDDGADAEEVTSISEDVLKMPAIEALRVSSPSTGFGPNNIRKNYQKINSDPSLIATRKSASVTRESTGSRNSSATAKKELVLHTIQQPDGGVIGFLAEPNAGEVPPVNGPESKQVKK